MSVALALIALALFQIKHYLADFQWQSGWMIAGKARYGHPGGVAHAGLHALLSLPILVFVTGGWSGTVAGVLIAEGLVHYHIDWLKLRLGAARDIGPDDREFWHLVGLDQMAHQMTYLGVLAVLAIQG